MSGVGVGRRQKLELVSPGLLPLGPTGYYHTGSPDRGEDLCPSKLLGCKSLCTLVRGLIRTDYLGPLTMANLPSFFYLFLWEEGFHG